MGKKKTPTQPSSKSAWSKGPPPRSSNSLASLPRSQSPAPSHAPSPITISHSHRPSTFGQGLPINEGVSVPRSNVGSVGQGGSAVTQFGSIDDLSPPLSYPPAATPVVKTENVKSFGSIPATPSTQVNGKPSLGSVSAARSSKLLARSAAYTSSVVLPSLASIKSESTSKRVLGKADIAKLFQSYSSDTSSPNLPQNHQPSSTGQHPPQPPAPPSQLSANQYVHFLPGMRPQQGAGGPRSPVFTRTVPNGTDAPQPMIGPGELHGHPTIPASPRLAPRPHQPPPTGVSAQQVPFQLPRASYYYPLDHAYVQPPTWFYPHHMRQQPHPPHTPHPPASTAQRPPQSTMPLSPQNSPPILLLGTPTILHAVPRPPHTPHTPHTPPSHSHQTSSSINISSPPPTPPTTAAPSASLNNNAAAFVPTSRRCKAIVIRKEDGTEVKLEALMKKHRPQPPTVPIPPPSSVTTSCHTVSIRIESEKSKRKRKRKEQARLEQERKDVEERAKKEEEERRRKEEEIKQKEEEERKKEEKELSCLEEEETRIEEEQRKADMEKQEQESADREEEEWWQQGALSTGIRSASVSSSGSTLTASQGGPGPGGHSAGSKRTRNALPQQGEGSGFGAPGTVPILRVALEISVNRWVATSTVRKPSPAEASESPEIVDRKVRALLNKLTIEKFDSISDQIIAWANKSKKEKDGSTLIGVIRIVYEKAIDEPMRSEMYARLCRKMMENISPDVQDDGIRNPEGKPIAGGQLFKKYLLNRCQEDFERGWVAKEVMPATTAAGSGLYSYDYAAQKAKRQGLIKFIGELFKLQMLTDRVMHECVKKLLGSVENPEEEVIESLCQLLKTVGQLLDVTKARAHMDIYFTRMKELSFNVSPRIQFMLQDVIELRDRKWAARGASITPSAVHEAAAKEKEAAEAQSLQRIAMSRGGSRCGGDRTADSGPGPDGRTTAGSSVARSQPKAGDLSQSGKISKPASMVMVPSSVFTKKDTKCDSLSRTSSNSSMISMLSQNAEPVVDAIPNPSRLPSRNSSVDFGQGGATVVEKLKLLPRPKPSHAAEETPSPAFEDEPEQCILMPEADARKKIDEDTKEFFAVRSLDEADVYFTNIPEQHRYRLVEKLVASALESKVSDVVLVSNFFAQAESMGQCSYEAFENGFMPMAELLDDIAIDTPDAFRFMAIMIKGAGLDQDEERLGRIAGKSMDGDKLLHLLS